MRTSEVWLGRQSGPATGQRRRPDYRTFRNALISSFKRSI